MKPELCTDLIIQALGFAEALRRNAGKPPTWQLPTLLRRLFHCRATPADASAFFATTLSSRIKTDSAPSNNALVFVAG
jgi:hypothetical protein